MKLKVNGSILILIFQLCFITGAKVSFLNDKDNLRINTNHLRHDHNYKNDHDYQNDHHYQNDHNYQSDQESNHNSISKSSQQTDKNEIRKRVEESNKYHLNINELEFDYFNMLTNRKKKDQLIKDNEFNYLKNQLIKPPYMYTNYHQMTIEDQLNNDQSNYQQTNKETNNQFMNDHLDQLTLGDRSNLDQLNNDKTVHEDLNLNSNNKTTNQTIIDQHQQQQKKNWFVRIFNKLKTGLGINSNVNLTATLNSTAIKEKLKYYEDYDVWMGIRIAYWLFSLFTIFTLFVAYKSYRRARKQARHRRESEKNRRKADNEQIGGSNRTANVHLPPKLNSVKLKGVGETSSRMSNAFLKVKASKEQDSN